MVTEDDEVATKANDNSAMKVKKKNGVKTAWREQLTWRQRA